MNQRKKKENEKDHAGRETERESQKNNKSKKENNRNERIGPSEEYDNALQQETTGPRREQEQQRKNQIRCEETRSNQRLQCIEGLIGLLL